MGKASRNARNSLTRDFARLQNSGKSIFHIAMLAKCDPMAVFLHYSPDGDGRRRNEGLVAYLRKSGAHWSLIAASQGMSYDEIKTFDSAGTSPSGAWLRGVAIIDPVDEQDTDVDSLDDGIDAQESDTDEDVLESEILNSLVVQEDEGIPVVDVFVEGQRVRLTEESVLARGELQSFSGEIAIIIHIEGDQILIKKFTEDELDAELEYSDHQIVSPDEIIAVVGAIEPKLFDEVIFTKVGKSPRKAKIIAIKYIGDKATYSLNLQDDSTYDFASRAEIEIAISASDTAAIDQRFYFKDNGCDAVGIADEKGGITLLKGSRGKRKTSRGKTGRENICNDRLELFEDGKVMVVDESIELLEDHYFKSFHRAISGLMGYNTSGQYWKTADGKTYSQIQLERNSPEELFVV